jgi:hypothetical protein
MIAINSGAVSDTALTTDLLLIAEQHPQSLAQNCAKECAKECALENCAKDCAPECAPPPKAAAAHASIAAKHFPYARIDRKTVRRTRRLGPALSLSTTRRVYPDEDAAASIAG